MYKKKITTAGRFITVKKIFAPRYGCHDKRAARSNPTSSAMKAVNEAHAIERLANLLNANFRKNKDMYITLTYENAPDAQKAKAELEKFMRKLRSRYKKKDKELKYVQVTEYENKRIHHHLVANDVDMIKEVTELWLHGFVSIKILSTDDLTELASYLIKETSRTCKSKDKLYGKRWNSSRNLTQPKIEYEKIHSKKWKQKPPDIFRGARLIPSKTVNGYSSFDGRPYQTAVYQLE